MVYVPKIIEIETGSFCHRKCSTCLRNSNPDREAFKSWFEKNYLSIDTILGIVQGMKDLGFNGGICLSHYNEPLYDLRLEEIINKIKKIGEFKEVFFHSNGDILTPERAKSLDGIVDRIVFAVYPGNKPEVEYRISSWFDKTSIQFTQGKHIVTHYSSLSSLNDCIKNSIDHICLEPRSRLLFNHKGEMLMCCDDVINNFKLGSFPDMPIEDLLQQRDEYGKILEQLGGRRKFAYCSICPRE